MEEDKGHKNVQLYYLNLLKFQLKVQQVHQGTSKHNDPNIKLNDHGKIRKKLHWYNEHSIEDMIYSLHHKMDKLIWGNLRHILFPLNNVLMCKKYM